MKYLYLLKSYFLLFPIFIFLYCATPTDLAKNPDQAYIKSFVLARTQLEKNQLPSQYFDETIEDTLGAKIYYRARIFLARHVDSVKILVLSKDSIDTQYTKLFKVTHTNADDDQDSVFLGDFGITKQEDKLVFCEAYLKNNKVLKKSINFKFKGIAPKYLRNLESSKLVVVGDTLKLSVDAIGSDPLSYQWFLNGNPLQNQNSSTLLIPNFQTSNAGNYHCTVQNPYSTSEITSTICKVSAVLSLENRKPEITFIGDQTFLLGQTCTLLVKKNDPDIAQNVTLQAIKIPSSSSFDPNTGIFIFSSVVARIDTLIFEAIDDYSPTPGVTQKSIIIEFTSTLKPPQKVLSLKVPKRSATTASLTWRKGIGLDTFKIYRSMFKDNGYSWIRSLTDTSFTDSNLESKSYYYYLTAHNSAGVSPSSDTVSTDSALVYINSKPQLSITGIFNLRVGEICTLDVRVNDPDSKQTVAVQVLGNPPGSSYNSTTKKFIWTSSIETSATIKLIATDNGQPSLSDTITQLISFSQNLTAPKKPVGFFIPERSISVAVLKWKALAGADTFRVYRSSSKIGNFELVKTTSDSTCKDSGLTATTYYYYIKAFNKMGPSPSSDTVSTDSAKAYVNTKPRLQVTGNNNYSFGDTCKLIATATDPDYPAQTVSIKLDALPIGATFDGSKLTWKPSGYVSDLIDTILFIATDNGSPILSDTVRSIVKFVFTLKPPSKPLGLQILERSATSDSLKWSVLSSADSFKIFRSTVKNGSYQLISSQTGNAFKDQNLQAKTTYFYYIIASNKAGNSQSSDTISTDQALKYVNAIPQFTIEPSNHAIKQNVNDTLRFTSKDQDLDNLTFEILKIDSLLAIFGSTTPKAIELIVNGDNAMLIFRPGTKMGEITFQVRVSDGKAYDTSVVKVNVTMDEASLVIASPDLQGSGTTTPAIGSSTLITANSAYQLSATPTAGHVFVKWTTISGTATFTDSLAPNSKVTIGKGTTTIKPVFAKRKFTLTISTVGTGSTTPIAGSIQIDSGAVQTLSASAGTGYRFVGFTVVGANSKVHLTTSPTSSVWLEGDGQIQAVFLKQFTITMKATGNGTVSSNKTTVDSAETVTISASASSGSGFEKWVITGNGDITNSISASTTVKIYGNVTIDGIFKLGTYQLTIQNDGNGVTNPTGVISVSHGVAQNISATPNTGFKFVSWSTVEGSPQFSSATTANTTVTLSSGNATIRANFTALPKTPLPTFNPISGTVFQKSGTVTLNSSVSGASIYYTTDNSVPTISSNKYTNAIPITSSTTIKAIAVSSGMVQSDVATANFTINQPPTFTFIPMNAQASVANFYTATVAGSDPEGKSVSFSIVSGPTGLQISQNGSVSWPVSWFELIGSNHVVKIRVSDPDGGFSDTSFEIKIVKHIWRLIPGTQQTFPFAVYDSLVWFRYSDDEIDKTSNSGGTWVRFTQSKISGFYIPPFDEGAELVNDKLYVNFIDNQTYADFIIKVFDVGSGLSNDFLVYRNLDAGAYMPYEWTVKNNNLYGIFYQVDNQGHPTDIMFKNLDYLRFDYSLSNLITSDNGTSFFYCNDSLYRNSSIDIKTGWTRYISPTSKIISDKNNCDTLYAYDGSRIYRSTNALQNCTFSQVATSGLLGTISKIETLNGKVAFIITSEGLYFTNDGFQTVHKDPSLTGANTIVIGADKKTVLVGSQGDNYSSASIYK